MATTNPERRAPSTQAEAELKSLRPHDRELVVGVLETYPLLSLDHALEMLKYFGGL